MLLWHITYHSLDALSQQAVHIPVLNSFFHVLFDFRSTGEDVLPTRTSQGAEHLRFREMGTKVHLIIILT